ncbi:MAG: HD domain-containing phosphohydrolase [Motiliproteus sp.]
MTVQERTEHDGGAGGLTVFSWIDQQHQFLDETYDHLLVAQDRKPISRCLYLAHKIQHTCEHHAVGLLAGLQLNRNARYQYVKELYAAVLCELMGRKAGIAPPTRLLLICAALTQDIGMLDLQEDRLDKQPSGLSESQLRQVQRHPLNGLKILKRVGVIDPLWLQVVAQHHERLDGSGYPLELNSDKISQASRILTVVDSYVAMSRPRGDRAALLPRNAMAQIFQSKGAEIDAPLAKSLISLLGTHPPGSWIELANDEIAVVVKPGVSLAFPVVGSVISPTGEHLDQAILRDTSEPAFTMIEMVKAPFHFSLASVLAQLWPKILD